MRQEKSSPNKPGLTNQIFLHTAVELAELSNVVKRKANCIGWRRNFKRHNLLHWQLEQNSIKVYYKRQQRYSGVF